MKTTRLLIASICLVLACRREDAPPEASSAPADVALDEQLIEVARRVPGFGGMYFDDDGNLNVYMVGDPAALAPEAQDARRAQLAQAVIEVYGADFLAQGKVRRSEERREQVTVTPPVIRIIKADYDILQLVSWRAQVDGALGVSGVVFTDLDERSNRLKIGIGPDATREQVEAAIRQSGVPREAVVLETTQPVYPHSTLRDKVRPMPGAVQVEADTGVFAYKICTMGFNAIRTGVAGFVTNSHCTTAQGGSNGTDFHQPNDPLLSGNHVGDEIADPGYFTGGACPSGRRCRFSDSAFIDYTVARGSHIARTTGWNNGLLTISSPNSRLLIVGEMSSWVAGSDLDKIGRTTGWTFGLVNGTCQNTNVAGTDITLFCQHRVNRLASQTQKMSDNGDSGSPVFRYQGLTVLLSGILWGGPNDGSSFVFSPIDQVEQELGALTTFNFPQPQPPTGGMCPSGQKCCEIEMVNNKPKCVLCVPTGAQCP
ncbi:MAG: hypothetical protein ABR576_01920 [Thermoanaerobaculia bacterium]